MTKSEFIKEYQLRYDEYIRAYIKESEASGATPSLDQAVSAGKVKMQSWLNEEFSKSDFSTTDKIAIEQSLSGYAIGKMNQSYQESILKQPRKTNKEEPVSKGEAVDDKPIKEDVPAEKVKESNEEALDGILARGREFMKLSLEDLINGSVEQGTFPTEERAVALLKSCIEDVLENDCGALSDKQKQYIKNQLTKYIQELIRTVYKPISKNISVSKETETSTPAGSREGGKPIYTEKVPVASGVSEWAKTNISFSGCDMVVSAEMRTTSGERVAIVIGSLQTLTYSVARQISAVYNIGNINAKDYVSGPRTIAGTMIFTVLNQHWGAELLTKFAEAEGYKHSQKILMDEVAPLDLTVSMANEYGIYSRLAIYGVRFFTEGQVMSINDIYTENTFQYVALNIDYLVDINANKGTSKKSADTSSSPTISAVLTPVNDGGEKVETKNVVEVEDNEARIAGSKDKTLSPDGKIMDISKYKTRDEAISFLNSNKTETDAQLMARISKGDEKAASEESEVDQRYRQALLAVDDYFKDREKSIPEELVSI